MMLGHIPKGVRWLALGVLLVTLLSLPTVLAQEPVDQDVAPQWLPPIDRTEGGYLEVGVEYVANYPGTSSDLPNCTGNAWGLYNYLRNRWWCASSGQDCFIYGNQSAWEQDFKRHDLGGTNDYYVDNVDLVFYEGHGNPSLFTFKTPWGAGTHDDSYLTYSDAYRAWGTRDAEWIALLSCSVLADSHQTDWSNTMNGLHLLMGFKTTAYDVNGFGTRFAEKINAGYRIKDAWFIACDQKQPSGVQAKVLAEEYHHSYDTQYYQYPDHVQDATYWVWTKYCGTTQPPAQVSPQQVGGSMPIFETPALSLAEAQAEWGNLTTAFQVPTQTISVAQDEDYYTTETDGRELEMDIENGLYYYIDHNKLFSATVPSQINIMTAEEAKLIADQFLADNGLAPGDAKFSETTEVTLDEMSSPGRAAGVRSASARILASSVGNYQVMYERVLTYTHALAQQTLEFSVVGPGSKLKVYVSPEGGGATVAANGGPGAVAGAQGGWRGLKDEGLTAQATVDILPYAAIEHLFQQVEPEAALEHVPFEPSPATKTILSYTLGYWEESSGQGQAQLYPAYILDAKYEGVYEPSPGVTDTLVVTGYSYIAANETYMSPLARIESTSDLSKPLGAGQVVTFTASDASQTLAELGYHESLTFTMGSGLPGSYVYTWYLNDLSGDPIGTGRDISYTTELTGEVGQDGTIPQTVILKVEDVLSPHTSQNSSTDTAGLSVLPPMYMPMVLRNW